MALPDDKLNHLIKYSHFWIFISVILFMYVLLYDYRTTFKPYVQLQDCILVQFKCNKFIYIQKVVNDVCMYVWRRDRNVIHPALNFFKGSYYDDGQGYH